MDKSDFWKVTWWLNVLWQKAVLGPQPVSRHITFVICDFVYCCVSKKPDNHIVTVTHLHVVCRRHLRAVLSGPSVLSCGRLPREQMFLMPLVEKCFESDSALKRCQLHDKPVLLHSQKFKLSSSLWALETLPAEKSYIRLWRVSHLIRPFSLENTINYRRKLMKLSTCCRWPCVASENRC